MRRSWSAIVFVAMLFVLWGSPAIAQLVTFGPGSVPSLPLTGGTVAGPVIITGATTLNGGVIQGAYTGNLQNTGQLILRNNDATVPWSLSTSSGLVVLNTMTGNYTGSTAFNRVSATYSGTGPTAAGVGVATLSVSMAPLAGEDSAELYGLTAGVTHSLGVQTNTNIGEYVAFSTGVTVNDTTRVSGGRGAKTYSINAASNIGASGSVHIVHAVHVEQAMTAGATVEYRDAFSALAQGNIRGSVRDAAYTVSCTPNTTTQCYGSMITLQARPTDVSPLNNQVLSTTGSLIDYDVTDACVGASCPMTLAHGIYLPNVSFTFDYMVFKNWSVNSAGHEAIGEIFLNDASPGTPPGSGYVGVTAVNTGNTADNVHCMTGFGAAGCWEFLIGTTVTAWIPYYTVDPPGYVTLTGATATGASSTIRLGMTTVAAGAGGCPSGTIGGQVVQGCWTIATGGVLRNVPLFPP